VGDEKFNSNVEEITYETKYAQEMGCWEFMILGLSPWQSTHFMGVFL